MTRTFGVVVGIVEDVDDPLGQSRIRVRFPSLPGNELSGFAPIARPMAGPRRGHYFMPEVGDEALLAFENGDVDHPFVIGFLHNGIDLPPDDGIDTRVRRLRTVSGHVLEFDDRAGRERVLLQTKTGHRLEMDDTAGTVTIRTTGGQQIRMADRPPSITLTTTTGGTVAVDETPGQVEVRTPGGTSVAISDAGGVSVRTLSAVKIRCVTADLTASAVCSVKAPLVTVTSALLRVHSLMAKFTGVVRCRTLVAESVVSKSYTPGAGNLW